MSQYQENGVTMYRGTLDENKAERIEEAKNGFVSKLEEAYPELQLIGGGMRVIPRATTESMRANIIGGLNRRAQLIASINACTTNEQVWAVSINYDDLTPEYVPFTNYGHASGAPNTLLSTSEVKIGQVTITPSHANAKIKLEARCDLTKDSGTTIREATIAIRRGDSNNAEQVGQFCRVRSQNVASTIYGPAVIFEVDSPGTAEQVTYTLRGLVGAGNSTATRATLTATEI
jgi:hypothetical protein